MPLPSPDEIIDFWLGAPPANHAELMAKEKTWFRGGVEIDRTIIQKFGEAVQAALNGELDHWKESPRSRLALVLLLDQFSRNVFRDDPRMYSGDSVAQKLALDSFSDGSAETLPYLEKFFLSLPLLHSENLQMQREMASIAKKLGAEVPELYWPMSAMHLEQSAKYLGVVERFGRFPHRNGILQRQSTQEELEFLGDWAAKAAPKAPV